VHGAVVAAIFATMAVRALYPRGTLLCPTMAAIERLKVTALRMVKLLVML
jgi:hypothetical protein